jgi:hypothetical protein
VSNEKRLYAETYFEFCFTFITELINLIASSVGRFSVIRIVKPAELREHVEELHPENTEDTVECFQQKDSV